MRISNPMRSSSRESALALGDEVKDEELKEYYP
jgi:hypothetical protein